MKKLFAVAVFPFIVANVSSATADENDAFIGFEYAKPKIELTITDYTFKDKARDQYGVRAGGYLLDEVRVYTNVNYMEYDESEAGISSKVTNYQLTISADYLVDFGYPVKPFIGATVGASRTELKFDVSVQGYQGTGSTTQTGFAYGAQAGLVGQLGEFDIELGCRYMKLYASDDFFKDDVHFTTKAPYLAVSYKF